MALTIADFNAEEKTLSITKSYLEKEMQKKKTENRIEECSFWVYNHEKKKELLFEKR